MDDTINDLRERLEHLKTEHRDLDDIIARLVDAPAPDLLQLQRLKKRKLLIKDQVAQLESGSIPNIIA